MSAGSTHLLHVWHSMIFPVILSLSSSACALSSSASSSSSSEGDKSGGEEDKEKPESPVKGTLAEGAGDWVVVGAAEEAVVADGSGDWVFFFFKKTLLFFIRRKTVD